MADPVNFVVLMKAHTQLCSTESRHWFGTVNAVLFITTLANEEMEAID